MRRVLSLSLMTTCLCVLEWSAHFVNGDNDEDQNQFMYLSDSPEAVFPIEEFKESYPGEKPAFLYDPNYPFPRIVEFYAHWCPHCQHFKPKYIELARRMKEVTDTLPDGIHVETRAVSCVPNKVICNEIGVNGYPTIKIFPAFSINATAVSYAKLHPKTLLATLGIDTDKYSAEAKGQENAVPAAQGNLKATAGEKQVQNQHFQARSKKETFDDAHLSFDFLLRNGVYTSTGPLSSIQKTALNEFVKTLSVALPRSSSLYPIVEALSNNRGVIAKSEESLVELLDTLDPPPSKSWSSACTQHGTGYTCGLWTLFHILSVGVVEWNLLSGDAEQRLAPMDVADALRGFIEHFFQCDECRAHFLSEYDSCGHERCNRLTSDIETSTFEEWKQLPLWLYEFHNGVNTRLREERLANHEDEDTTSPWQVQWPPVYQCAQCWLSQGRWDEDQVYRFLRLQYWPEDYKSPEIQKHLDKSNQELHPDVVLAVRKHHAQPYQDPYLDVPHSPLPLMTVILFSVASGYAWHRKRRFDQKGFHKKQDSSSDC